jgi:hypothetical protein
VTASVFFLFLALVFIGKVFLLNRKSYGGAVCGGDSGGVMAISIASGVMVAQCATA